MKLALSRNQKSNPQRAGYTLVEIMIVVSLIGLLTAIGIPNFLKSRPVLCDSRSHPTARHWPGRIKTAPCIYGTSAPAKAEVS